MDHRGIDLAVKRETQGNQRMKAITLTEPWATLVALGEKKIETRGWACYYRGPLAIHSARTYRKREFADITHQGLFYSSLRPGGNYCYPELNCGKVIAVTSIVGCERITEAFVRANVSPKEYAFGNYQLGRYAFLLGPVERITPVVATGHLMLWEWEREAQL